VRTRLLAALGAFVALVALAPAAQAAPPPPFGHACAPLDGALYCPTAADAARVPSFDGVPLDADVFLPPTGDGPFPTIAMLHGFAGSKADPEAGGTASTTNASFYARNGYAVLVPSARGFGRSCGVPDSRTGACARGWLHVADQRFEVRDVQHLLGLLSTRASRGRTRWPRPASPKVDPCTPVTTEVARGTAIATRRSPGFTLLGRTTISARVRVRGANAQLVGRLWDVDLSTGRQRFVDRGVVRLRSARTVSLRLNGNGWRFARGHTVKVELLGRDAPTYRPSNGSFSVDVSRLRVVLPTRERARR
jgi:hypothetical protein